MPHAAAHLDAALDEARRQSEPMQWNQDGGEAEGSAEKSYGSDFNNG